mmetsp:Transcript_20138/g.57589  ORF Transcript_20138/g.57589 Transcript_20138/m.57589 type:complete len:296 (+) Transcript_20138:77-964(+)
MAEFSPNVRGDPSVGSLVVCTFRLGEVPSLRRARSSSSLFRRANGEDFSRETSMMRRVESSPSLSGSIVACFSEVFLTIPNSPANQDMIHVRIFSGSDPGFSRETTMMRRVESSPSSREELSREDSIVACFGEVLLTTPNPAGDTNQDMIHVRLFTGRCVCIRRGCVACVPAYSLRMRGRAREAVNSHTWPVHILRAVHGFPPLSRRLSAAMVREAALGAGAAAGAAATGLVTSSMIGAAAATGTAGAAATNEWPRNDRRGGRPGRDDWRHWSDYLHSGGADCHLYALTRQAMEG